MHTIALIPARAGSKRIKDKNIRLLGGVPLMAWSIRTAHECGLPCYVSTDSATYAGIAREYQAEVIDRPGDLAADGSVDDAVVKHALSVVPADLVVYLRPTTPFREASVVMNVLDIMQKLDWIQMLRSCHRSSESFAKGCYLGRDHEWHRMKWRGKDYSDKPNQECPVTGWYNGYVDICRGSWDESKMYTFETEPVVEIDTEEQWEFAEYLARGQARLGRARPGAARRGKAGFF